MGSHVIDKVYGKLNKNIKVCVKVKILFIVFFFLLALQPIVGLYFAAHYRAIASSRTRFLDHTQRRAIVGRTPLDE